MAATLETRDERILQRRHWEQAPSGRRSPDHPVVRAVFEPRADYIAGLVPDAASASILDVGSGNGFMTAPLEARFGYVANLDLAEAMLRANPCGQRLQADAVAIPFDDDAFDIVTCSHLLHHMVPADRHEAVCEMVRVARHRVVLYEPNRNNPLMFAFGCAKKVERMSLAFSPSYMARLLTECGAKEVTTSVVGLLVPNKAPIAALGVMQRLQGTPVRALGFYVRVVARP